jgi:hypothetical protein
VNPHTAWCARDHRCNLADHRSPEIVFGLAGSGRVILTRVVDADGQQHAEVRLRLALSGATARYQLHALLTGLRVVVNRAALRRNA